MYHARMPELPEAEIARRQLERWLSGRTLDAVELVDRAAIRDGLSTKPSDAVPDPDAVVAGWVGRRFGAPARHGKRFGVPLDGAGLLVHLGMSGKLLRTDGEVPAFARVGLVGGGGVVWLVDRRRFGCLAPVPADGLSASLARGHGPDALLEPLDGAGFAARLRGRVPVKVALMDQARIAGLGNIQAVEALFLAEIDPRTACDAMSMAAWDRLAAGIPPLLERSIAADDGEAITYVNEGGENPFAVYGRAGEPCPRCGGSIASIAQSGRSTFFCPGCQR